MTAHVVLYDAQQKCIAGLHMTLRDFIDEVGELKTPDAVLDALHVVSTISLPLNVLGAARFPRVATDWGSIKLGKSVFLHGSVPKGWWEEYVALADKNFTPALFLARTSLASFTWTETRRALEPIGVDRWSEELALKYGMRDGLTYPVGARWVVVFWSPKVLTDLLSRSVRFLLCAAANLAAQRLEQLAGPDVGRLGTRPRLTPRETAVLRLVSMGRQSAEIAKALDLGEETVRSHLKKAQAKLGAHNRTQAACEALRQNLIP